MFSPTPGIYNGNQIQDWSWTRWRHWQDASSSHVTNGTICLNPQVKHDFMCEVTKWKQQFLMQTVCDKSVCCFKDATELFGADRTCVRHGKSCVPWQVTLAKFKIKMWSHNHISALLLLLMPIFLHGTLVVLVLVVVSDGGQWRFFDLRRRTCHQICGGWTEASVASPSPDSTMIGNH